MSLLDIVPTVLDWFGLEYPHYRLNKHPVQLTGKSLLSRTSAAKQSSEAVFSSQSLHEITMYYPMRTVRTRKYRLIQNLNYKMPFPIDQDFYLSPTFQNILERERKHESQHWFKSLKEYYYRPQWELYDLESDPKEMKNVAEKEEFHEVLTELRSQLGEWQNITSDPWICAPSGVLEDAGDYKLHPVCMPLLNDL